MRKWLVLILTLLLLIPFSAQAQSSLTLDSLKISLWSEYDQPSMLVIYDFKLPASTPLPASVKILVPKDGNITAVAYSTQPNTTPLNAEFAGPVDEDNWQVITVFVRQQATYHVEYYEPLTRDGNNRSFKYQWSGKYAVNDFRVETRLPVDSTAVKSNPILPFAPNQDSLIGSAAIGNLKEGAAYQVDLSYVRNSEETSVQASSSQATTSPVTASESVTQNTAGRVTLNNLPYILGGIGVLLILGAVYYFWRSNSLPEISKPRRRAYKARDENTVIYCHECGTRAGSEDRFCRVCGTKLRTN